MPAYGLTHVAGRVGDHNDRAMTASPVLTAELARRTGTDPVAAGRPAPALGEGWQTELAAARPLLEALADRYEAVLADGLVPVTALGRCAAALATLPVVARHRPDAAVVWFDAHADLNTPATTGTGYLGGLALAGPLGLWDSGLGAGLAETHAVLAGARDLDPFEQELVDAGRVVLVGTGEAFAERLADAVAGRPVYVHVDCDVLEPDLVPTDHRVPGGLALDELHDAAEALARSEVVGLEVGALEAAETSEATRAAVGRVVAALAPLVPQDRSGVTGARARPGALGA